MCVKGEIELYGGKPEIVLHDSASWYAPKGTATPQRQLRIDRCYRNSGGRQVHCPAYLSGGAPAGAPHNVLMEHTASASGLKGIHSTSDRTSFLRLGFK
jgi:hypothetical protein